MTPNDKDKLDFLYEMEQAKMRGIVTGIVIACLIIIAIWLAGCTHTQPPYEPMEPGTGGFWGTPMKVQAEEEK